MCFRRLALVFAAVLLINSARAAVPPVQTVFVIVLENNNWASFRGSASAPFLNSVLLPAASYCEQYYNPTGLHPSEPNYLWLEAATNFGIFNNSDPAINHLNTTNHLTALLPSTPGPTGRDRKSTRLNSSHVKRSRMPSSA